MFFVFSFLGWIWESVIFSMIDKHRVVNRGFMNGPYIPIYGAGALIDLLLLGNIKDMVLLFFVSACVCTMVEYLTSYAMEKMFNARWWDYYDMFWHLNGRICLEGFLAFGGLSVVLIQWVHPATMAVISKLSPTQEHVIAGVLFALFLLDFIISVKNAADFEEKMRRVAEMLISAKDKMAALYDTVVLETVYRRALGLLTKQQKRMLRAFPAMRSIRYPGILKAIRSVMPGSREKVDLAAIAEKITEKITRMMPGRRKEQAEAEDVSKDERRESQ